MNNIEEIRKVLNYLDEKECYLNDYIDEKTVIRESVNAIHKQLPLKPLIDNDNSHYLCPICCSYLESDMHNYCCNCGQRINWDGCRHTSLEITTMEKAIEAAKYAKVLSSGNELAENAIDDIINFLKSSNKGYWIEVEDYDGDILGYCCSECDAMIQFRKRSDHCPKCGIEMNNPE